MAQNLNNPINRAGGPVDDRTEVQHESDIDSLESTYVGQLVHVRDNDKFFRIKSVDALGSPTSKEVVAYTEITSDKIASWDGKQDAITPANTLSPSNIKDTTMNDKLAAYNNNGVLGSSGIDTTNIAVKSEMSITDGTGADAGTVTIQLKSGTSKKVLTQHQSLEGKVDKVPGKGLSTNDYDDTEKGKVANAIQTPSANNAGKIPVMTDNGIIWETKPDTTNPFKGWFDDVQDLPTNLDPVSPVVGDYAYVNVVDETDPQNPVTTTYVYRCVTEGEWPSSSSETTNPSNNPSFRSGETIHNIPIDNSQLSNPSTKALAKAIDVVEKIQPIDFAINGNPGTQTEQEIDYSGPDNEYFKAAKRKLIPDNGRITYNSVYTYDTVYYYQVNIGDVLNIHIPKLGTTNNSATILGFSTREYPNMSDLSPTSAIVKFDKKVSDYGSNYADNEGQGYDIENYTVEVDNVGAGTSVWLVICAYGVVTDYTTYTSTYIPTVNRVITTGQTTGLSDRVEALESGIDIGGDGILDLNPEKEIVEKLKAAKYTDGGTYKGVTFAHISDYHCPVVGSITSDSTKNYERFLEFVSYFKDNDVKLIDDAVDTGDLTDTNTTDNFDSAHEALKELDGFDEVLLINGNHDTDVSDGTRWYGKIGKPVYDREFKAHAEPESGTTDPWGVTFPTGAGSDDYYPCYYHKDYSTGSNPALRAIFLDVMGWDTTQQTWLNTVLAEAQTNGKHVIIFAHYLSDRRVAVKCSYCRETGETGEGTGAFNGEMSVNQGAPSGKPTAITNGDLHSISYNVQQFIDAGGVFVGYICGHRHLNKVGYLKKYPKQWFVNITSCKRGEPHDYANDGKRGQDNFELVTVNTFTNCLNLIKIGGRYNNAGSLTNTLGINYDKGSIVSEGYSEPIRATFGDNKNRPYMTQGCDLGYNYYDTTIEELIHWDGKKWAHADGTAVVDASDTTRPTTNIGTGYQFKWTHEVNSESQEDLIIYQNDSWRYVDTSEFVKDSSGSSYNSVTNPTTGYQFWDTNDLTLFVYSGSSWVVKRY